MPSKRPVLRRSSRHVPKGIEILFEDDYLLVVSKVNGLLTISTDKQKVVNAHYLLSEYVKKGNSKSKNRVFIVHRLDRDTSGVLVFAKSEKIKDTLQENWKNFSKTYKAVVLGKLAKKEGLLSSYLIENKAHRMYASKDPSLGKLAKTAYKVIRESNRFSLLEIDLITGRKHQIRVHFADIGHPLAGDKVYGKVDKGIKKLALHAASLTIIHPVTKDTMTFEAKPPPYFKGLVVEDNPANTQK